jgi:hypothetical protein
MLGCRQQAGIVSLQPLQSLHQAGACGLWYVYEDEPVVVVDNHILSVPAH